METPNPKTHLKRAEIYLFQAKDKRDAIEQGSKAFRKSGNTYTTNTGYICSERFSDEIWVVSIYDCYLMKQFTLKDYFRYYLRKITTAIDRYFGSKGFIIIVVNNTGASFVL